MILNLHSIIFISLLSCTIALNLIEKFMPKWRHNNRLEYSSQINAINHNYIPLYMKPGPSPQNDYMANSFQPRYLFKRFHRTKRQVKEDDRQFQDLLGSFGGDAHLNPTVTTKAITETEMSDEDIETSTSKTGFYFLLDWNSFFVLDDQNGKRVNLRIQPKVGDPKRFFSVTVP